jgi:excisionase family DNA binding protein
MDSKLAYSIDETSQISNTGRTAIYDAINRGELVARKRGTRTLILSEDLKAWLERLPKLKTSN